MGINLNSFRDEEILAGLILIITAFLWINVNPSVGAFYTVGSFFYLVPLLAKRKDWYVPFLTKKPSIPNGFLVGVGVLVAWMFISSYILGFQQNTQIAFQDFFKTLSTYTNVPVLAQDPALRFLTWGVFIPIVESFVFLSFLLKYVASWFKVPVKWAKYGTKNFWSMIWVSLTVGVSGSMFHLTVRQVADVALVIDILFFTISALLVFRYKRLFEAMNLHILNNSGVLLLGG